MTRELKVSIKILKELNNSLVEITKASSIAFRNSYESPCVENSTIVYSVDSYLIIKASAFFDELQAQFEMLVDIKVSKELKSAVSHYKKIYKLYNIRKFRNYLAHNRKFVKVKYKNAENKPKTKAVHRYISDADLARNFKIKSHVEFEAFSIASARIISAIETFSKEMKTKRK